VTGTTWGGRLIREDKVGASPAGENPGTATLLREHFDSANLVARLNLPNMAYAPEDKLEVYAHAMRGLTTLEPDPERRLKYLDFIDIYAALDENERIVYRQRYPEEVAEMTRFAERFIQQGLERGRQEGREEGIGQGEARVLLRLLHAEVRASAGLGTFSGGICRCRDAATLVRAGAECQSLGRRGCGVVSPRMPSLPEAALSQQQRADSRRRRRQCSIGRRMDDSLRSPFGPAFGCSTRCAR